MAGEDKRMLRIEAGQKVAQLVVAPVSRATFELTGELAATVRGERGFGSSGI